MLSWSNHPLDTVGDISYALDRLRFFGLDFYFRFRLRWFWNYLFLLRYRSVSHVESTMPMNSVGQNLWQEDQSSTEERNINALRESVTLLLAVEPNCRACEMAWKVLKQWADQYQFGVRPIATTLTTLADGTAVMPYPQIIESLEVTEFPTLYLVQPSSQFLTRLGTGILTESEISTRLLRLVAGATPEGALNHASNLPPDNPFRFPQAPHNDTP